jgi:hypothetical protein
MALDIYQRQQTLVSGTFSADKAVLAVAGGSGGTFVNAMVQSVQGNYRLPQRLIGQLGSSSVARVVGRPEGQMTIGAIVGLVNLGIDKSLFDACNSGSTITLKASPSGCNGIKGGATVIDVGFAVTVEDLLIRRNLTLSFTSFNEVYS